MTSLSSTPEGGRVLGPDVHQHIQASETPLPLVSIITPCFNGEKHVGRLIESVLAQTYPNVEFILVNDGSTDGTDEVVRSYEAQLRERLSRFVYVHQENAGVGAAINAGLRRVAGEHLCWPDADDYLEPTSVEERVAVLTERKDVAVVTSDAYVRDATDSGSVKGVISTAYERNADPWQFELLLRGKSIFGAGVTWRECRCSMRRIQVARYSRPEAVRPGRCCCLSITSTNATSSTVRFTTSWCVKAAILEEMSRKRRGSPELLTTGRSSDACWNRFQ